LAKKVDIVRVKQFYRERNSLEHYNDGEIGRRMGLTKSSYSSYVNGRYPITNVFLKRFYAAFEEELKAMRENIPVYLKPNEVTAEEIKKIRELERKADKLIESHELIIMDIRRLEQKLDHVLEAAFEKMETLVTRMTIKEKSSVPQSPDKKKTKKSGNGKKSATKKLSKREFSKGTSEEGKSPK